MIENDSFIFLCKMVVESDSTQLKIMYSPFFYGKSFLIFKFVFFPLSFPSPT